MNIREALTQMLERRQMTVEEVVKKIVTDAEMHDEVVVSKPNGCGSYRITGTSVVTDYCTGKKTVYLETE